MPTQTTSIFTSDGTPGIEYADENLTWTIADNVFVGSNNSDGIFSGLSGSTLINSGIIFSGRFAGVFFTGDNSVITNNAGASIAGLLLGIEVQGSGATLTNHGKVSGYDFAGVVFGTDSTDVVLNSDGEIYGREAGVAAHAAFDDGIINNSGLIHSDHFGVRIDANPGLTTTINNAAGGTIEGDDAAIFSVLGKISLDNRGTIAGRINCDATDGNVNDVIVNRGKISGQVFLGLGNDAFTSAGGTSGKGSEKTAPTFSPAARSLISSTAATRATGSASRAAPGSATALPAAAAMTRCR
jgi:hypothetical protein